MKTPTGWKDITIAKYYNILDIIEMDFETQEDKGLAILSCLTDIPVKEIEEKYSISEIREAVSKLSFISSRESCEFRQIIKIKGRKFLFDSSLYNSTSNTFIQLSDFAKEPNKNIHAAIALFAHELNMFGFKKKRTIESEREILEFMKNNLTMDYAFGYADFFLLSYEKLQEATRIYLNRKRMKRLKMLKKTIDQVL